MKTQKTLALFLSCIVLCQTTQAQNSRSSAEDQRVARLGGLAKVWGTVKYFHPFLAYRDIDWDKALIETIPKVNTAKTAQEYQAAVNHMLAVLNDKSTRAEIESDVKTDETSQPTTVETKPVRTENRVLVIDAAQIAKAVVKDNSALNGSVANINQALPGATGVVIDARNTSKPSDYDSYFFDVFLRQILPSILDTNVVLGSARYRMHNGYATQTGNGASFYYSALVNSAPQIIQGRAKTKSPIAFIVNQHSPAFTEILSGLQFANCAFVIQEGEQAPESGGATFTIELPDNIKVRMRTSELINPDGSVNLQPDAVVQPGTGMREAMKAVQETRIRQTPNRTVQPLTQVGQKDKPYTEMEFPTVEYRLLALFRFWNVINYFYPYKKLLEDSWETVLQRYIPKFEANRDVADYQLTVRELVTEMHDSHGGARNTNAASQKLGMFQPPVLFGFLEDKSVVTKILDEKIPLKVGDVVLEIDGEPVEKRREFLSRYIASSTPQWLMKGVHFRLLLGPKDSVAKLRVRGVDGEVRDVTMARSLSVMDPKLAAATQRSSPIVQVLPGGYGYVDLARLQGGEVDKMFDTIKSTPAVIFDMRGYPNGTAWSIAPRLTEKKNVVAALFSRPFLEATSLSDSENADSPNYSFAQKIPDGNGEVYKGKVVMLINEDAISQAEHTCMFFEAATDVTFIGTPTAGANGDVTFMVLPGNLAVSLTGHNVRHADGRQLQRVGIQPTVRVAPTIRGTIEGRDEVLEAAVKYLRERLKQ
jgi:C-terminal processing protease CtpA/Prc